jgi:hypothetical protein
MFSCLCTWFSGVNGATGMVLIFALFVHSFCLLEPLLTRAEQHWSCHRSRGAQEVAVIAADFAQSVMRAGLLARYPVVEVGAAIPLLVAKNPRDQRQIVDVVLFWNICRVHASKNMMVNSAELEIAKNGRKS